VVSPVRSERMEQFYQGELAMLAAMDFDHLSHEDQIDYLLLKLKCTSELHQLALEKAQVAQMQPLLPFADTIESLMAAKRLMKRPDAEKSAGMLNAMVGEIDALQKKLNPGQAATSDAKPAVDPMVANRAVIATLSFRAICVTGSASTTDTIPPLRGGWICLIGQPTKLSPRTSPF